jgi:hypothetical protein
MQGDLQNTIYMNLRQQELERRSQKNDHVRYDFELSRSAARQQHKAIYAPLLASVGKLLISLGVGLVRRHSRELANVRDTMEILAVTTQSSTPRTADTNSY